MKQALTDPHSRPDKKGSGRNRVSLAGLKFTRLRVLHAMPDSKGSGKGRYRSQWMCVCDCGENRIVKTEGLKSGKIKSCGCLNREKSSERWKTHGLSHAGLRAYTSWAKIRERILCPTCKSYKYYGGRGIRLCRRWRNFKNFYADMGDPPEGMTIHRKENNGHYEPGNCIWADDFTQAQNKRSNINLTFKGETHCIAQWSRKTGIKAPTLLRRFHSGWEAKDILTTLVS